MSHQEEIELAKKFITKFDEIKKTKGDKITLTDIRIAVEDLTQKNNKSLYEKILAIAVKIHHLKDEFADIDADKVAGDFLPSANMKLEEVVKATEKATTIILDAATAIQESLEKKDFANINAQITKIFEACNFQDLTGQHINNVVATLDDVDNLIKAIIKILPEDFKKSVKENATRTMTQEEYEKSLAAGPQLSKDAPTQDDIDKIFAES